MIVNEEGHFFEPPRIVPWSSFGEILIYVNIHILTSMGRQIVDIIVSDIKHFTDYLNQCLFCFIWLVLN